jgi:small subunit ribosomal protein S8
MKDQISDLITRIRNGQQKKLLKIKLYTPTSNFCLQFLTLLYKEGYIRGFKILKNKPLTVEVLLKYTAEGQPTIQEIIRISKPSRRFYIKTKSLWSLKSGLGIFVLSTPKGLMTDLDAKILNQGGEVICSIL